MARRVSFATDIRPLFDFQGIQCMKSTSKPFDLTRHGHVKAKASLIYSMLITDDEMRMPLGGPYWSDDQIQLFKDWIEADCPE